MGGWGLPPCGSGSSSVKRASKTRASGAYSSISKRSGVPEKFGEASPIRLVLTVRKFFCRTPDCPYPIFTERLPDFLACSSRLTNCLRTAVQGLGFTAGGKGGERLSAQLRMPTSDAIVLWSLFLATKPKQPPVQVVGVDDWSWRRGRRFGGIFVNLETHRIVDMQAERDA